mgnify:CR=1 FL=1
MARRKRRNHEKSWLRILKEILKKKGETAGWLYVTALRGPDPSNIPWIIKPVFTGPLRGREGNLGVADVVSYNTCVKQPELILQAFHYVVKSKDEFNHYLGHLITAWYVLNPKVANILTDLKAMEVHGQAGSLSDLSYKYQQAVNEWLEKTEAVEGEDG